MRDVLAKMRECGKEAKMRDFPHDCGTVDTYANAVFIANLLCTLYLKMCQSWNKRLIDWLIGRSIDRSIVCLVATSTSVCFQDLHLRVSCNIITWMGRKHGNHAGLPGLRIGDNWSEVGTDG